MGPVMVERSLATSLRSAVKAAVPAPCRQWLRRQQRHWSKPPVGWVRFGSLRRVTPISPHFGYDRGRPVDRYYIDRFVAQHAQDIRGQVLEIGEDTYTRRFGGARVERIEVLHVKDGNPQATIVADLTRADHLPSNTFDCVVFTHTLQFIYDVRATLQTLHRLLKPGGVLLATAHGIGKLSRSDMEQWGEYWRFTRQSAQRLFGEVFGPSQITVEAGGNVLVAIAGLHGLAVEELRREELDYFDPEYEVVVTVRAVKAPSTEHPAGRA